MRGRSGRSTVFVTAVAVVVVVAGLVVFPAVAVNSAATSVNLGGASANSAAVSANRGGVSASLGATSVAPGGGFVKRVAFGGAGAGVVAPAADAAGSRTARARVDDDARIEDRPCPVAVPAGTRCGDLIVPERRDVPGGRKIRVGFAVHRSTAPDRKPDPVVYTSGGPASASMQLTGYLTQMKVGRDRDVVVLEQRGSRWSRPRLDCPEITAGFVAALRDPAPPSRDTATIAAAARACKQRLTGQGVDLRGYVTAEIAGDVVALRRVLGYRTWNLFGVSYSTRSMLAAAAADPDGTRSVVLDSFLPAQVAWYDDATANLSATLGRLEARYPGLRDRFDAMLRRFDRSPAVVRTTDPLTDRPITVRLTGDDVATLLAEGLHDADVIAIAPTMIDALADGRTDLLQPVADAGAQALTSHELGLYYAVQCQDEVPFNTGRSSGGPVLFTSAYDRAVCDAWGLPASPARVNAPVVTSAPVLVVGGTYDPTTPPSSARPATAQLPHGRFVEFAGVGHAVFLSSWCGRETISRFIAEPGQTGQPCDPGVEPYRIMRPGQMHAAAGPYRIDRALGAGRWWVLVVPVLFALGCLAQLVTGIATVPRGRRVPALLLTAGGIAGLGLLALLGDGLYGVAVENETILGVGVPVALAWYGGLAAVSSGAFALAASVIGYRSAATWREAVGRVGVVVALAGVLLAVAFSVWWHGWFLGA